MEFSVTVTVGESSQTLSHSVVVSFEGCDLGQGEITAPYLDTGHFMCDYASSEYPLPRHPMLHHILCLSCFLPDIALTDSYACVCLSA